VTPSRIVIVGSFMQALCWQLQRSPQAGETLAATGFSSELAGKGLAVAVGCRRLGAEVDLLLSVGDDLAGDALLLRLQQEDVPTCHVTRHAGVSGHGAGWLSADGGNSIAVFAGANAQLDASQVALAEAVWPSATLVYAQLETPKEAAREAFTCARRRGATTVLNPSPWQALDRDLLACTQVLIVNETEAAQLVPGWRYEAQPKPGVPFNTGLQRLWASWPGGAERRLVVTLGARGSMAHAPDGDPVFEPALSVDVCSSVGAGDAFSAGFCTLLSHGHTVAQALRYGTACGAFAVSHHGILDALPFATDVAAWRGAFRSEA